MVDNDIFEVLNKLGLSYDRRISPRGSPYAGFQLVGAPGASEVRVTVVLENNVLRLTSHGINTSADALAIIRAGARLPLGAAYRAPEDGSAELSMALFVGEVQPSIKLVSGLLDYTAQATAALSSDGLTPHRPPLTDDSVPRADFRVALAEYGHHLTPVDGGVRMEVPLVQGLLCAIVLSGESDGWIVASASYLPEQHLVADEQTLGELQKLQRWAATGRFVVDEALTVRANVPTPLLGTTHARSVVWTVSQCAALLQTAAGHLRLPLLQTRGWATGCR